MTCSWFPTELCWRRAFSGAERQKLAKSLDGSRGDLIYTFNFLVNLKFTYSEKATKFCEIFTLLLSYVVEKHGCMSYTAVQLKPGKGKTKRCRWNPTRTSRGTDVYSIYSSMLTSVLKQTIKVQCFKEWQTLWKGMRKNQKNLHFHVTPSLPKNNLSRNTNYMQHPNDSLS